MLVLEKNDVPYQNLNPLEYVNQQFSSLSCISRYTMFAKQLELGPFYSITVVYILMYIYIYTIYVFLSIV